MVRICLPGWNSINPDLVFTGECQDDYPQGRLPTDFEIWEEDYRILFSYYQKPTQTPFVIMEKRAMGALCKYQTIVEQYIRELKNSGYSQD